MPPRRRKRNAAQPVPSPPEQPSPARSRASATPASDNEPQDATDTDTPPFFNATFSMYRVSPLYIGKRPLTPTRLNALSKRLRDTLVGDVVRGVQVGLETDASLGRTGALESVEWRWVDLERILGARPSRDRGRSLELGSSGDAIDEDEGPDARTSSRKQRVLSLELRYENARFGALLLPDLDGSASKGAKDQLSWTWETSADTSTNGSQKGATDQTSFLHLPLLLLRMPVPLRSVLVDFLCSTFDVRISALSLGTQTLVRSWEGWLADSDPASRPSGKDVSLTLGFHIEPPGAKGPRADAKAADGADGDAVPQEPAQPGLKTIEITIPSEEIRRFLHTGAQLTLDDIANPPSTSNSRKRKRKADPIAFNITEPYQRTRLRHRANPHSEEGWAWLLSSPSPTPTPTPQTRHTTDQQQQQDRLQREAPFTAALATYLRAHLALNLLHPGVRITRVACEGFVASEAGRVRVHAPVPTTADAGSEAVWRFVGGLAGRARGWELGAGWIPT
ncbi:kinetochore complex Sim4 subunit Fta1-domain-containing protein [Whalleya microplaca]|nr:kinetochore complex Sim4 subunit Fta1-domain-containing protein [Whalleya microplaca]